VGLARFAGLLLLLFLPAAAGADSSGPSSSRVSRFLVSVPGEGVFLFDLKAQVIWSHRCDPYDACLGNRGQVWIADRRAGVVFSVDREGQRLWEKAGLQGPVNVEALPNGNILILENTSGRALELKPGGETLQEFPGHVNPFDCRRRPNGNTVVADSGNNRIVEYEPSGKVRVTGGLKFPNSLCLLPNGNTLFTTYTSGTVGELDATGALVWERQFGGTLYSVEAEGENLWISDGTGGRVILARRDGTILQEIRLGKSFLDVAFCR
jgi:sugar lactone lactonase YvrE